MSEDAETKVLSTVVLIDEEQTRDQLRSMHTRAGEVRLKVPTLRRQTFETAIIER